jgi:hypothetical protein
MSQHWSVTERQSRTNELTKVNGSCPRYQRLLLNWVLKCRRVELERIDTIIRPKEKRQQNNELNRERQSK